MVSVKAWYKSVAGKRLTSVFGMIWIFGAGALILFGIWKYGELARRLRESLPYEDFEGIPVRVSDVQGVPMTFGIFRTKIYVPLYFTERKEGFLTKEQKEFILRHEFIHVKRHDPFWKLVAILVLGVHWWNPIVWVAYLFMAKDMEMACDEGVLEIIGTEKRAEYAKTLLCFAASHNGLSLSAAFGESNAESRIKNVVRYQKNSAACSVLLVMAVILLGGCLATKPAWEPKDETLGQGEDENVLDDLNGSKVNEHGPIESLEQALQYPPNITLQGEELEKHFPNIPDYAWSKKSKTSIEMMAEQYQAKDEAKWQALLEPVSALELLMNLKGGKGEYQKWRDDCGIVGYVFADGSVAHYEMNKLGDYWVPGKLCEYERQQYEENPDEYTANMLTGVHLNLLDEQLMEKLKALQEAFESVTAKELRKVEKSVSEMDPRLMYYSYGAWEGGKEGDYIILQDFPERDACIYGLYGGEKMLLRIGDKTYPVWQNWSWNDPPKFYAGDFDGDGETEYAMKGHLGDPEWRGEELSAAERYAAGQAGFSVDFLTIWEIKNGKVERHEFKPEDRGALLQKALTYQYHEENYGEGKPARYLTMTTDGNVNGTVKCYLNLSDYQVLDLYDFQGIAFGFREEFKLFDDQWYYIAEGGIEREGLGLDDGISNFDRSVLLCCKAVYREDGSFALEDMELKDLYFDETAQGEDKTKALEGMTGVYFNHEEVVSIVRADVTHDGRREVIVTSVDDFEDAPQEWRERMIAGAVCHVRVYRGKDVTERYSEEGDFSKWSDHGILSAAFYDEKKYGEAGGFDVREAIYEKELACCSAGYGVIYVARKEGKEYLLTECHTAMQGEICPEYRVFALDEQGQDYMVDDLEGPFIRINIASPKDWKNLPVEEMLNYSQKLNAWISKGTLLAVADGYPEGIRTTGQSFGAFEVWQGIAEMVGMLEGDVKTYYLPGDEPAIHYRGPEKVELSDMGHLKEALENIGQRWQALREFLSAYYDIYGVEHEQADGKEIVYSELTGDFGKESIVVSYADFLEDSQNWQGDELWSDELWGPHPGWGKYYHVIYGENHRHYLLYLKPIENTQGIYQGEFKVFSFDEMGNRVVVDERSINSTTAENYTKEKSEYMDALNRYLERSFLIVSTWEGELELYDPKKSGGRY